MDREKFVQIIKDNKWVLYKVINIYCKDIEDKKDLEQEIIIQLWRSFESFNADYKLSTWIYRIAKNVAISFFRSNRTRKSNTTSIDASIFQEISYTDNSAEKDENRRFLYDFINQLDEFNREIALLYLDDYSYKEIADIVGISESNVGTKLNRIKKKLQEYFITLNNINNGIQ